MIPDFDPADHVVLVPAELPFATKKVERATAAAAHPVWVVVLAEVVDGVVEPGHSSETEDALEAIRKSWSLQGFDTDESSLAVLSLDEREVRLRAGTRWDLELSLGAERLLPFIDEHFLPLARVDDLDGGLAAMVTGLDRAIEDGLAARRSAERRERMFWTATRVGGGLGLLSVPVGLASWLALRSTRARRRFEEALEARRAAIRNAEGRWADLGLSVDRRDQVVALKLRGPRTTAVVRVVTAALDRIRTGLDAIANRLTEVQRSTRSSPFTASGWEAGLTALDAPFPHDTGAGTGLFEPERRTVQIDPIAFAAELEADWVTASEAWETVLDAVDASMRQARDDLPLDDLARMHQALATAGLPEAWVRSHPLAVDPAAAWDALDETRRSDPVAYLDQLRDALDRDDELEERVAALVGGRAGALAARAQAESVGLEGIDTVTHGDDDLDALRTAADVAFAELERRLAAAQDFEGAIASAEGATEAARRLAAVRTEVLAAVREAPDQLAAARRRIVELDQELAAGTTEIRNAFQRHAPAGVVTPQRELVEAAADRKEAGAALAEAEAALARREHLAASRLVALAMRERDEAVADLRELRTAITAADVLREEALGVLTGLGTVRASHEREITTFGRHGLGALAAGDQRLAELRLAWERPGDWAARTAEVKGVLQLWRTGRDRAASAWRSDQATYEAELRAIDESRNWRAHAFGGASHTSGTAYRSTSSRSTSSSSSRSSSSSSRSAGRSSSSSSSSSRSAGRSVSSSSRSAGRKF